MPSIRFMVILSSHLCLWVSRGCFPSCFPTEIQYAFVFTPIHSGCPNHLILIDLILLLIFGVEYKPWNFSCYFLRPPVTSKSETFLSTVFLNTFSVSSYFNMRDYTHACARTHRVCAYKTTDNIRSPHIRCTWNDFILCRPLWLSAVQHLLGRLNVTGAMLGADPYSSIIMQPNSCNYCSDSLIS
jgi:hypothetical protein